MTAVDFPKRSPDLNPMDFCVWEAVTQRMAAQEMRFKKTYVETLDNYKARLRRTAVRLTPTFFEKVWGEFKDRLNRCYAEDGGHFREHRLVRRRN